VYFSRALSTEGRAGWGGGGEGEEGRARDARFSATPVSVRFPRDLEMNLNAKNRMSLAVIGTDDSPAIERRGSIFPRRILQESISGCSGARGYSGTMVLSRTCVLYRKTLSEIYGEIMRDGVSKSNRPLFSAPSIMLISIAAKLMEEGGVHAPKRFAFPPHLPPSFPSERRSVGRSVET